VKNKDINFEVVKEYMLLPDEDGFTKESVDKVYIGKTLKRNKFGEYEIYI